MVCLFLFLLYDCDLEVGHEEANDDDKFSPVYFYFLFYFLFFEVLEDRMLVRKDS